MDFNDAEIETLWGALSEYLELFEPGDDELSRAHYESVGRLADRVNVERWRRRPLICKFCKRAVRRAEAHLHGDGYVCDDCWDERLRTTA